MFPVKFLLHVLLYNVANSFTYLQDIQELFGLAEER
jgi:hypothetical protein